MILCKHLKLIAGNETELAGTAAAIADHFLSQIVSHDDGKQTHNPRN